MKRHLLKLIIILTLIVSCKEKETKKMELTEPKPTTELKSKTEIKIENKDDSQKNIINDTLHSNSSLEIVKLDTDLIEKLFKNLKSNFEIDFKLSHLDNALNGINLSELKNGKVFEKEMLFEDFECKCFDKITVSYSEKRYLLDIYEEFYEEELDWCPESSYRYSFMIINDNISDLKLDYMAG
ncbi:hypothetical protein NO995_10200 [Aestuariibaculum sp. M13]|uniref:hypothetical protein n=1 Tax=Aestuariibaculum sp. M13 TaxID=2967132 RepID=UPI00215A0857|nr:hypothetical protein [Aestuariibaculum sp. M13]MCR8668054.1 hypothetical protein [Aestuariibaculum sp. M13]